MDSAENCILSVVMLTDYPRVETELANGGVINAAYWLVQGLQKTERLKLFVLCPRQDVVRNELIKNNNVEVTFFPYPRWMKYIDHFIKYRFLQKKVDRFLKEIKPNIVHAQGNHEYVVTTVRSKFKHVVTIHGIFKNEMPVERANVTFKNFFRARAGIRTEKYYMSKLSNVITITEQIERLVLECSPQARLFRINNAINDVYFGLGDKSSIEKQVILFVAAVRYRKGLHVLLEAFDLLSKDKPQYQLHVIGRTDWDEQYVQQLKLRYKEQIREGKILFFGPVSQKVILQEFERCSMLCLPSFAESQPMVIIQAFAASKPVVATNIGGIPQMIEHGMTGYMVDPENPDQLQDFCQRLLENQKLRREMGCNGRNFAKANFSTESVSEKTVNAYRTIVEGEGFNN